MGSSPKVYCRSPDTTTMQAIRLNLILVSFVVLAYQFLLVFSSSSSPDAADAPEPDAQTFPDLYEASIAELQDGLSKGLFTSVDLVTVSELDARSPSPVNFTTSRRVVQAYFARIEEVNLQGPVLRAVIETNPSALAQAAALDRERQATGARGPLHGIPILLKDNIATQASDGKQSCLAGNRTDAHGMMLTRPSSQA